MNYVYLLKSKNFGKLYFGYTTNLKNRFKQHNSREVKSTSPFAPWVLIYYEAYSDKEMAKDRERKLKYFGKAYGQLKKRVGL